MHRRTLGATGLVVSEISLGCNRIGGAPRQSEDAWIAFIHRALDLGINFFDTAANYARGRSEELLGRALAGRSDAYICSKVGRPRQADGRTVADMSAAHVTAEVEDGLRRLGRDSVDVMMLHSPHLDDPRKDDGAEALRRLKEQGKVRHWGISLPDGEAVGFWAIEAGAEVLQVEHNLLLPAPERELFPLARERGVGIVSRIPLAKGVLSGKYAIGSADRPSSPGLAPQGAAFELQLARLEQVRFLERSDQTLAQAALRYVLSDAAVSCAIPGARTLEQLEANASASNGVGLGAAELSRVREVQRGWS